MKKNSPAKPKLTDAQLQAMQLAQPLAVELSEFFKCFADPTRLKIINSLLLAELCGKELVALLHLTPTSISHHLQKLRQMRLVKSRRKGKLAYYTLDDYHIPLLFELAKNHASETRPGKCEQCGGKK